MSNSVWTTLSFSECQFSSLLVGLDGHCRSGGLDVQLDVVQPVTRRRPNRVDRHLAHVGADDSHLPGEVVERQRSARGQWNDFVDPLGFRGSREHRHQARQQRNSKDRAKRFHR